MTLNDLERRNSPYFAVVSRIRQIFRPIVSQWLKKEDRRIMSVKYCILFPFFHFCAKLKRTLQRGISAIAEHIVTHTSRSDVCSKVTPVKSIYVLNVVKQ